MPLTLCCPFRLSELRRMASLHRPVLIAAMSAALLTTVACHRDGATPAASTQPTPPPSKPKLGDFGFDMAGMDRSVAPGDDFFGYASGNWVKTTQIPQDRSSFNSFTSIAIETERHSRDIIEGAAANDRVTGEDKQIGDYYAAYMDEASIEAKGVRPVQPELDAIAKLDDKQALARTLGGQLRADVDLLNSTNFYTDRLFGLWVSQDLHHTGRYAPYLVQGGLGMPERSFYLDGRAHGAAARGLPRAHRHAAGTGRHQRCAREGRAHPGIGNCHGTRARHPGADQQRAGRRKCLETSRFRAQCSRPGLGAVLRGSRAQRTAGFHRVAAAAQ